MIKKRIRLRTKMVILSFIIVFFSVVVSGFYMIINISNSFEDEIGERSIAIARTIAQMEDIQSYVGRANGEKVIQPVAERVRLSTNVDYVVILDMDGIRYSHPSESRIGQKFASGDEGAAFAELEYISKAEGDLGLAIRAFVPIMEKEGVQQIGVAVVGILVPTFQSLLSEYQYNLYIALLWGLLIGLIGSWYLANNVKKQTNQLEPYEIARLMEERLTIMETLDIGIVVTNERNNINYMNALAQSYIGLEDYTDKSLADLFTKSWLVAKDGTEEKVINRPLSINKTMYLVSIHPILVKEQYSGDLITLTSQSEARELGEELTGVKSLLDALRAQNHEHMNMLHSIAGLIQLERLDEALELIIDEASDEEDLIQLLRDKIYHHSISGLLLGKRAKAKEVDVDFAIDVHSYLSEVVEGLMPGDIVTILGNLIDNAIEASIDSPEKEVTCLLQGSSEFLHIVVADKGAGFMNEDKEHIFTRGFSTKAREGRGIGLSLVKDIVEANSGTITVTSDKHRGTTVEINIKN